MVLSEVPNDSGFSFEDFKDVPNPDCKLQMCKEKEKNLALLNELTALKVTHEKHISVLDGRLNKALRGLVYGDVSSEVVLMMLEKKLRGKIIIKEEDYMQWKKYRSQRRLISSILGVHCTG